MFSSKKDLANVLSVLVVCPQDNTFLLLFDETREDYWLPSTKMDDKLSWKDNLQIFKKQLFDYEIINEKLLKIIKIWSVEKELFHLIFQVSLPKEIKTNCKTQTQLGLVGWYTCPQIMKLKPHLRSLEILEVTHNLSPKLHLHNQRVIGEIMPMGSLTEVRETDLFIDEDNCQDKVYFELLQSAGIPIEVYNTTNTFQWFFTYHLEQYGLYEEYIIHTYPCIYMNFTAFKRCATKLKFMGDCVSLFRAADVWGRDFLTFQDYLFLIAVMEPYTNHYGNAAEIRCRYIFRYYNKNRDGKLSFKDFENLMSDIQKIKNPNCNETEVDKEIRRAAKSINFKANSFMTFDKFYSYVLQSKIEDTKILLRFIESHCLDMSETSKSLCQQYFADQKLNIPSVYHIDANEEEYKLLMKPILLKPYEIPLEIRDLKFLEDTMTRSVAEELKILSVMKIVRKDSYDLNSKVTEMLLALKYFSSEICESPIYCGEFGFEEKDAYSWGSAYLEKLGIILILMCEQLKDIFSNEPRLLKIDAPVYIMGDLHGNFHDLICFEKVLWNNGMGFFPGKVLFLGDYVDRGANGLEVIMYLFANKILYPSKFYLIRGNHEIRDIQKLFTFQRECIYKLGPTLGMTVWKAVNDVFDTLPLAGVVDNKVFCCHGGIPPPWLCPVISLIDTIPCPLKDCEKQSPLAWALMWNDPIKNIIRNSVQELELVTNEGFMPNTQRGTAFVFNCDALERFLKTNSLSHVVRAHEVVKAGFQIHQKGKLLTVFSSSGYCGGKNFAAGVSVSEQLLRVFIIDTGVH